MIEIKAWHWLVFGMVLILSELIIPSFTIIWFGLGALIVSTFLWYMPTIALSFQLLSWTVGGILFTMIWFLVIKPRMFDKTKAGISLEAVLGESGLVITIPGKDQRGVVKFTTPLLGAEEWRFICHETVMVGDRVTIIDVSGNTLIVTKK